MGYRTASALEAALREYSRRFVGDPTMERRVAARIEQDAVRRFVFQRLLARVFTHDPNGWVLKGGQALLVRYPDSARYSRDIDLYRPSASTLDDGVSALMRASRLDLGDHLRFTARSSRARFEGASIVRVVFDLALGTKRLEPLRVDLATHLAPVGMPARYPMVPALPMEWPEVPWPDLLLYPVADHLADKVCALYTRHHGVASSRYRDLVDLVLMGRRERFDGRELKNAICSEFTRSRAIGLDITLPQQFVAPDSPQWAHEYEALASQQPGLEEFRTLRQATMLASSLLNPVLAEGDPPGQWLPGHLRWEPLRALDRRPPETTPQPQQELLNPVRSADLAQRGRQLGGTSPSGGGDAQPVPTSVLMRSGDAPLPPRMASAERPDWQPDPVDVSKEAFDKGRVGLERAVDGQTLDVIDGVPVGDAPSALPAPGLADETVQQAHPESTAGKEVIGQDTVQLTARIARSLEASRVLGGDFGQQPSPASAANDALSPCDDVVETATTSDGKVTGPTTQPDDIEAGDEPPEAARQQVLDNESTATAEDVTADPPVELVGIDLSQPPDFAVGAPTADSGLDLLDVDIPEVPQAELE